MFAVGLDPGKQMDPAALAVVERVEKLRKPSTLPGAPESYQEPVLIESSYHVRALEQAELGTPYTTLAERVATISKHPRLAGRVHLIVDDTGVGTPVLDMLREYDVKPVGVTITGGTAITDDDAGYNVPKRDLVTTLAAAFQQRRIEISQDLKLASRFKQQLLKFTAKITRNRNMTFEALTEEDHDDLVIAVALAVWYLEKINGHRVVVPAEERFKSEPYPSWDPLRSGL